MRQAVFFIQNNFVGTLFQQLFIRCDGLIRHLFRRQQYNINRYFRHLFLIVVLKTLHPIRRVKVLDGGQKSDYLSSVLCPLSSVLCPLSSTVVIGQLEHGEDSFERIIWGRADVHC